MSEEMIIEQCAPTLAAIKTGSLFTCPFASKEEMAAEIRGFNKRFVQKGLCMIPLRFEEGRALVLLFRPEQLRRDLEDQTARQVLRSNGYERTDGSHCVSELVRRFGESGEFPHEIGLFLSYPPEDVKGFIEHKAGGYKCAGLWKVYGDEQRAQKLFRAFRKCTNIYCGLWRSGKSLEQLAVTV